MENENGIRINKYLSEAGVCSRREADKKVEAGEVTIDGVVAVMGDRISPGQEVRVSGQLIEAKEPFVLLLVNKPIGIVCTLEKREKDNIINFLNYPHRIYPIGRLDKDSSGLLLMTNQGDILNKILRAGNAHEKEYIVSVNKEITEDFLEGMRNGVPILDTITRKCVVEKIDKRKFKIILTQGLNRQIRRMCEHFNYRVVALKRVRIMNLKLGDLPVGQYREITQKEWTDLQKMIEHSSSETVAWDDYED